MIVDINGSATEVDVDTSLHELIEAHAGTTRGSAVVVDGTVVPRSDWTSYRVNAGQRIELITAVQGG